MRQVEIQKEHNAIWYTVAKMKTLKHWAVISGGMSLVLFIVGLSFGQVNTILMDPMITAADLNAQAPSIDLGGLVLQQPSSTALVFLLGLITILVGMGYVRYQSFIQRWLGINFILWGLGAWVAGISYQAFGAALKCVGDAPCSWTNGVELFYMVLTVLSINALLVAYSGFTEGKVRHQLQRGAMFSVITYGLFQGLGMILPIQFLLSYEFMLIFLATNILLMTAISYRRKAQPLHRRLWQIWLLFLGVNAAYFVALFSGYATPLYQNTGLWFNENDVLHVLLAVWMVLWITLVKPQDFDEAS